MRERNCPACRTPLENNVSSSGECLSCGHDLVVTAPPPGWFVGDLDLRAIAQRQRELLWIILASIVLYFTGMLTMLDIPWLGFVFLALMLLLSIYAIVCVLRLQGALCTHVVWRVVTAILIFAPCIGLLILLGVNGRATTALQRAGLKVRFMGVRDDEVVKLLSSNRCSHCGYLLIGIPSERCPECGEPIAAPKRIDDFG